MSNIYLNPLLSQAFHQFSSFNHILIFISNFTTFRFPNSPKNNTFIHIFYDILKYKSIFANKLNIHLINRNMDKEKVDTFILSNMECFCPEDISLIRYKMENTDDSKWSLLGTLNLKDPQTALMLSIFGGPIGIDRIYIGDYLLGVFKTITCGGLLIWAFIDQFLIKHATKKNNMKIVMDALNL